MPTDPERLFIDKPLMTSVILGHCISEVQKESVLEALRTYTVESGNIVKIKRVVVDTSSLKYILRIEDCGEI